MQNTFRMKKEQTHYYTYSGKRYENMKDCKAGIGPKISTRNFKKLMAMGVVVKTELA